MRLEKPLYTLLLVSLALTLLTVLQPPVADAPTGGDDLLSDRHVLPAAAEPVITSWRRPVQPITAADPSPVVSPPISATPIQPPALPDLPVQPPVIADIAVARPTAPEPAFRYLGRLNRDDQTWVFILQGGNSYAVPLGQTFEGHWRFDAVQADRLDLTYLPLRAPRSLSLRTE